MINFKLFLVLLALSIVSVNFKVSAQLSAIHDFNRNDSVFLINESSDTLLYPFAGGLNSCQVMNIDMNLDGIADVLVFDRHGNRILPFIVSASPSGKLLFNPELASLFPPIEQWMQAIDYNQDGKKDIFTYTTGGVKVYCNESESELKFTQVTKPFLYSLQGTTLTNILVTYADYPVIADVDGDGDTDLLTFWGLGSFVEYHRNTSIERFGIADSLTYEKASSCWGHFAEGNESNAIVLDTCPGVKKSDFVSENSSDDPKHTGSTLLMNDLNGDGLPDLIIGDVDFSSLVQLTNGGSVPDAMMVSQPSNFPNSTDPVSMNTFPAAMLADVDNDGLKDLLVSPFDPSLIKGENFESVSLYHNSGTNAHPDYQLASKSFLQDQMLDLGSGAYPVFFDSNGDGLQDFLVGNYGYEDSCVFSPVDGLQCFFTAKVALLLNIGTTTKPVFKLVDRNIAHLDSLQMQSLIPSVADMDGDGDMDLVCGNSKGKLVFCENIALPGQPADFKLVDPAWKGIDVGDFSAPQLFDMDQDGVTDLICGERTGTLNYYKNTGTKNDAQFTLVSELLGGVNVTNPQLSNNGYSVPCFYKDKYDDIKLFSGSEFGDIFVYDQLENNLSGSFRLVGTLPGIKEGWRSGVAFGNLNNDTLTDMLVGNYSGGMGLFLGKPDKIFGIWEQAKQTSSSLRITPNPASNDVSIDIKSDLAIKSENLLIQGMAGNVIRKYSKVNFPISIDVTDFKNGIYLVSVQTNKGIATGKMVICR
ncbi:MAG: FG-GAP-like repeat-containing protein [Bacteroidales bacterium]|nr:FG-GAP-like repeat-containing protein [Bacteroidales bacterium]